MKKIVFIVFAIILNTNMIFAHSLLIDGYNTNDRDNKHPFEFTVEEATELAKSGNPLDVVIAYKEEHNNKIDGSYQDIGEHDYDMGDIEDVDFNSITFKLSHNAIEIENNIDKNIIPEQYEETHKIVAKRNNTKLIITCAVIMLILFILFKLLHKKIFLVLSFPILLFVIFCIVKTKQIVINKFDNISNYALTGEINEHISKNVLNDENIKIMDYINGKFSIAMMINDLFTRIDACVQLQKNNEKLDENIYMFRFQEEDSKYRNNFIDDVPFIKYTKESENPYDVEILKNGFSFEDLKKLCINIKNDGLENYNKSGFVNDLIGIISSNKPNNDELLFHYLKRISNSTFIRGDEQNYFDNSTIAYFKDWYIEGKVDKDIDLPYGITLHYEAPMFIKKDIKEVLYTNEGELDNNSKERQVFVMYYKDSNGELKGTYTDVEFVKTGDDYVINFNPYELLYDIKKPVATLTIK